MLCCTGAMPVPVRVSVTGEFAALLTKEMDPDASPDIWGRNVTVNGMVCPSASVTGKVTPLSTNSGLEPDAE